MCFVVVVVVVLSVTGFVCLVLVLFVFNLYVLENCKPWCRVLKDCS